MINLTPLFNAFIAVMAALAVRYLAPYIRAKTDAQSREEIDFWVHTAVAAAEQLYNSEQGKQKKEYVLNFLTTRGFCLEPDEIDKQIEAAVLALHKELVL